MDHKRWCVAFLAALLLLLAAIASVTIIVDPWFHYHAPLESLEYPLNNQRHQNDGILKHFEYDAIITGTSMTENFKTSEFDKLFGTNAVKTSYAGASYKEISDAMEKAMDQNPNIRYILRSLDETELMKHKDTMSYDLDSYPWYLYDDIWYNDVKYILNKTILFTDVVAVFEHTLSGKKTTSFDDYKYWANSFSYGQEAILGKYERKNEKSLEEVSFSSIDLENLTGTIQQNVISQAKEHPDVVFYYFIPPYSIYWWDDINQSGELNRYIDAMKEATRQILVCENIQLFCFFDEYEMVCDPQNYKDRTHYSAEINSRILNWMYNGAHRLDEENYEEYWENIREFYNAYEYEQLFP